MALEEMSLENVDDRRTDDDGRRMPACTIISPMILWLIGELKI